MAKKRNCRYSKWNPAPLGTTLLVNSNGYKYLMVKVAEPGKWMYQHRHAMEQKLGRPLQRGELVHHLNHDRLDNRPENLEVMSSTEHNQLHCGKGDRWSKKYERCIRCGRTDKRHASRGRCMKCYNDDTWAKIREERKTRKT